MQVMSMQSAKGVMQTWDETILEQKVAILTRNPEATMNTVGEFFPKCFQQLQCYVLVADVLEVIKCMIMHCKRACIPTCAESYVHTEDL